MVILVDAPLLPCTHILLWKNFEKFQNGGLCYLQEMNTLWLFGLVGKAVPQGELSKI